MYKKKHNLENQIRRVMGKGWLITKDIITNSLEKYKYMLSNINFTF